MKQDQLRGRGAKEGLCLRGGNREKTSFGLLDRASLPKFPAVEIDGAVVFEGCDVSRDQLEQAIRGRQR